MRFEIIILIVILILTFGFALHNYVFSIYEVTYSIKPEFLYITSTEQCVIEAQPINGLGFSAPFRSAETKYEVIEGNDLIEIEIYDKKNGLFSFISLNKSGIVTIKAKSDLALFPTIFEVPILDQTARNRDHKSIK